MFARSTWAHSASLTQQAEIQNGVTYWRERVLPSLQTQAGFLGAIILVNSETGEAATTTYWESAEALSASDDMGAAGREEIAQKFSMAITDIDRFEVVLQDRAAPAQANTFVRVNDIKATRDQIDAALGVIRGTISQISSLSGYRAALIAVNRVTGRMLVASSWDSAAAREASEAVVGGLRQQLVDAAKPHGAKTTLSQVVLAEVSQAAQQAAAAATTM